MAFLRIQINTKIIHKQQKEELIVKIVNGFAIQFNSLLFKKTLQYVLTMANIQNTITYISENVRKIQ